MGWVCVSGGVCAVRVRERGGARAASERWRPCTAMRVPGVRVRVKMTVRVRVRVRIRDRCRVRVRWMVRVRVRARVTAERRADGRPYEAEAWRDVLEPRHAARAEVLPIEGELERHRAHGVLGRVAPDRTRRGVRARGVAARGTILVE